MDCLSTAVFTGFALVYGRDVFDGVADRLFWGWLMVVVVVSHLVGNTYYHSLWRQASQHSSRNVSRLR